MEDQELHQTLAESPLLRLVALAGHVTSQRWARVATTQHGLTPAGVNALLVLARDTDSGRSTHAELARRLYVRPATLTGVVDTLVRAGYLVRERDESDRRVVWLVLTKAGKVRAGELGVYLRATFDHPPHHPDPARDEIIREYLIDVIMRYHQKESLDEWMAGPGPRGSGSEPREALSQAGPERDR